jgi:NDP-sugar pyrophosphorylase family protein
VDYLSAHDHFGMRIEISREDVLLDTGGGLKKAAWFFQGEAEPFIVHNVDVVSTIDLARMIQFHNSHDALATLAVKDRETSRPLLFDDALQLCGRKLIREGKTELVRTSGPLTALAFSGIHVISTRLLDMLEEDGVFSIIPAYLRLASHGEKILGFRADEYYWRDLGRIADLKQAERDLK